VRHTCYAGIINPMKTHPEVFGETYSYFFSFP
jgi:hypothetical protein